MLFEMRFTYTLFDVLFLVLASGEIIIEHCFEVSIVSFTAWSFIVNGVGE